MSGQTKTTAEMIAEFRANHEMVECRNKNGKVTAIISLASCKQRQSTYQHTFNGEFGRKRTGDAEVLHPRFLGCRGCPHYEFIPTDIDNLLPSARASGRQNAAITTKEEIHE